MLISTFLISDSSVACMKVVMGCRLINLCLSLIGIFHMRVFESEEIWSVDDSLDACFDVYLSRKYDFDSHSSLSRLYNLLRYHKFDFLHWIMTACILGVWRSMYEVSLNVVSITMCFAFAYQSVCRRRPFVWLTGRCAFEQKGDSRCRGSSEEVYRECSEGIAQYSSRHWLFQQILGETGQTRMGCLLEQRAIA